MTQRETQLREAVERAFWKISKNDPGYKSIYAGHIETIMRELTALATPETPSSSNTFTVGPDGKSPYHVNCVPVPAAPETPAWIKDTSSHARYIYECLTCGEKKEVDSIDEAKELCRKHSERTKPNYANAGFSGHCTTFWPMVLAQPETPSAGPWHGDPEGETMNDRFN